MVVGRLFEQHDKSSIRYEILRRKPVSAIARPGHPLRAVPRLGLRDLVSGGWIVPSAGSVLRHRFELMFSAGGLGRAGQPDRNHCALVL